MLPIIEQERVLIKESPLQPSPMKKYSIFTRAHISVLNQEVDYQYEKMISPLGIYASEL